MRVTLLFNLQQATWFAQKNEYINNPSLQNWLRAKYSIDANTPVSPTLHCIKGFFFLGCALHGHVSIINNTSITVTSCYAIGNGANTIL